ncbi:MAG: hypothetical protein ACXVB6_08735 [Mucilaginibacter sp.]
MCAVSFSASAQLFHISLHKKHEVLPYIKSVKDNSVSRIVILPKSARTDVRIIYLGQSQYFNEMAAASAMRSAKHNMSWRLYNEASYNFSDLALCYIKLNRFSEAKWYLLQSIKISREENDDKHTVSNLISLALIKTNAGDLTSARADLIEARDLALAKGMQAQVIEIEKKMLLLDRGTATTVKPDLKYAETAASEKKAL